VLALGAKLTSGRTVGCPADPYLNLTRVRDGTGFKSDRGERVAVLRTQATLSRNDRQLRAVTHAAARVGWMV
jgi:hypothetical protein